MHIFLVKSFYHYANKRKYRFAKTLHLFGLAVFSLIILE